MATTEQTTTQTSDGDGINVQVGGGKVDINTPVFKMKKMGRGDKLHVSIPDIDIDTK